MERISRSNMQSILDYTDKDIRELHEQALENLREIGLVNPVDAFKALSAKDSKGRNTTLLEIREIYVSPNIGTEDRELSRIITLYPEITIEGGGQYSQLVLTFENNRFPDMNRIWQILESYGKESAEYRENIDDYPMLQLTILPLTLDGRYGFVMSSPIIWFLTPADPAEEQPRQIRMLIEPGGLQFVQDESYSVEKILEESRKMMASYKMDLQRLLDKEEAEKEMQREMEAEQKRFLEANVTKHTFGYDENTARTEETRRHAWNEMQKDGKFKVGNKRD